MQMLPGGSRMMLAGSAVATVLFSGFSACSGKGVVPDTCVAAPCHLAGSWSAQLLVVSPEGNPLTHRNAVTSGRIVFSGRIPDPWPPANGNRDSTTRYEFGRHAIDLRPILGGPFGADVSTTVMGGGRSLLFEVVAQLESGDSVRLTVIPRMSHGGLSLLGKMQGDTIRGVWEQNAYCCGATGSFVMSRQTWTGVDDSLLAVALADAEADRLASAAAEAAWLQRAGYLRVRTFDVAIGRYVDATYWIIRQGNHPEREWSTIVHSGADGWSSYSGEEPGTYRVELSEFPCGNELYFADTAYVEQHLVRTILIRSRDSSELDIRIDSREIVTMDSHENPQAARCTVAAAQRPH